MFRDRRQLGFRFEGETVMQRQQWRNGSISVAAGVAAAGGSTDIKEKLAQGVDLNGRKYRNYVDGVNQLDDLSSTSRRSRS
jgi:hypothetical protein